jgi:hypothetical protein
MQLILMSSRKDKWGLAGWWTKPKAGRRGVARTALSQHCSIWPSYHYKSPANNRVSMKQNISGNFSSLLEESHQGM